MGESLLTVEEAAARMGCGRTKAYEAVRLNEIESVKNGRLRRIPSSAVDRWIARLLEQNRAAA